MEIIKRGNKKLIREKTLHPQKFKCTTCGCVFVASKDEYYYYEFYDDWGMGMCACPCCRDIAYKAIIQSRKLKRK